MKLLEIKEQVLTKTFEKMKDAIRDGKTCAGASVDTQKWSVDTWITEKGYVEAVVTHYADIKRESANVEAFFEAALKDLSWAEAESIVKAENAETPEQEYARRGEAMFARSMQWHRI